MKRVAVAIAGLLVAASVSHADVRGGSLRGASFSGNCGNGVIDAGEECDAHGQSTAVCQGPNDPFPCLFWTSCPSDGQTAWLTAKSNSGWRTVQNLSCLGNTCDNNTACGVEQPDNARLDDDVNALWHGKGQNKFSDYGGLVFCENCVPTACTIKGIEVRTRASLADAAKTFDIAGARIGNSTGPTDFTPLGLEKTVGQAIPSTETLLTWGNPFDTYGTTISTADVNDGLAVGFCTEFTASGTATFTALVDQIEVKIHFGP